MASLIVQAECRRGSKITVNQPDRSSGRSQADEYTEVATCNLIEEFGRKARAHDHFLSTVLGGAKQFVKGNERELEEIIGER